jgi:hypothetical protein
MSGITLISSASPPTPDISDALRVRGKLNIPLEFGRGDLKKVSGFGQGSIQ